MQLIVAPQMPAAELRNVRDCATRVTISVWLVVKQCIQCDKDDAQLSIMPMSSCLQAPVAVGRTGGAVV
jgi:hypothetical protein